MLEKSSFIKHDLYNLYSCELVNHPRSWILFIPLVEFHYPTLVLMRMILLIFKHKYLSYTRMYKTFYIHAHCIYVNDTYLQINSSVLSLHVHYIPPPGPTPLPPQINVHVPPKTNTKEIRKSIWVIVDSRFYSLFLFHSQSNRKL